MKFVRSLGLLAMLALASGCASAAESEADRWNLTDLYATQADWDQDALRLEQQLPIHVAVICRVNKATAQNVLAQLTNDAALAEELADEFEVIIECFSHALQPLCLRHCGEQMSKARSMALANSVSCQ